MTGLQITGLGFFILLLGACATPQSINIETTPSGAAISVNSEYIGRSPAKIDLRDVGNHKELRIVAEKSQYDSAVKTIKKKRNRMFPNSVFLKLEPTIVQNTSGHAPGGSQQQTTIQGPTIIMPGAGPAPQVSSPSSSGSR
jgi:hypothetical protein